jgi:aminocarboxymuconate-semialdehyde decarboxylase
MAANRVVDVHTHFFPPGLTDFTERTGDVRWPTLRLDSPEQTNGAGTRPGPANIMRGTEVFRPVSASCWHLESRLQAMDAAGITHHVLSPVPISLTTWARPELAAEFAHQHNEAFAKAIAESSAPERFSWIGTVATQSPVAAVAELERGVRHLGMVGVEIGTEVGGHELDDPLLDDFWSAAEALDVAVFIHPTHGAGAIRRGGAPYEFGLGMLTDTAMAATALVFGGVLERHASLRVGLAHGCGTFPWAYPRLARGATLGSGKTSANVLDATGELVRRLWADTLVFDSAHLGLLVERFGADHLLLGSDHPFYPADWGHPCDVLNEAVSAGTLLQGQADAICAHNADRFLARGER